MLVQSDQDPYFNFVNSIDSDVTRKSYEYCLSRFLKYCNLELDSLLKLPQQELSNLIIKYLVSLKISRQYKKVIFFTIKHACEMNDKILNWKILRKYIKSEKTGNEIAGEDRGYTHDEIEKILEFSDQRAKTAFLILASTGMRIGALQSIRVGDLERIDNLYKITVYRGDREQYYCFCTPECAKEIDAYLDFRARRGEKITQDSYLLVRKFGLSTECKGKPFKGKALWSVLERTISNCGLREIDHVNPFKRKQVPIFHAFRKYYTNQLIRSNVKAEARLKLEGHSIGITDHYWRPTEQEIYEEWKKAIDNLTIDPNQRLQKKIETLTVEKSIIDSIAARLQALENMNKH
jgi:integrase